jgi:hypothetical protein
MSGSSKIFSVKIATYKARKMRKTDQSQTPPRTRRTANRTASGRPRYVPGARAPDRDALSSWRAARRPAGGRAGVERDGLTPG